ncbi:MAG: hypothetical protein K8S94_09100 [Planctomycetia bacterium]|nr:hypothetical protein [Planctomycetia bacterium]
MQRGYRDVGYRLAGRVAEVRPAQFNARLWRRLVMCLSGHVRRNEKAAIGAWFKAHYPALMHLIPDRRHREVVAGFIERTREEFELTGKEHVDPVAS